MSEESINWSPSSSGSSTTGISKISVNIDENQKDPNDYFDDGVRKIDFILVWTRNEGKLKSTTVKCNFNF